MGFEYNFRKWMEKVDAYVWVLAGCSMWDLVDHPWSDWHADRIVPEAAARRATKGLSAGGGSAIEQGGNDERRGKIEHGAR